MKLSESTLSLLKNFSTINQSILFKQGNKLRTVSVMKNILAEATIAEGNQITLYCWYDNEYGYTKQVLNLTKKVAAIDLQRFPKPID